MGKRAFIVLAVLFSCAHASAGPDGTPAPPAPNPPPPETGQTTIIVVPPSNDPNTTVQQAPAPPLGIVSQPEQLVEAPVYPIHIARWRLAGVQAVNAAALGTEICALLHPNTDSSRCAPFPFLLSGAVALTAGLAVRPGISSDHISAINGGTALAIWHGVLIMGMTGLYWPDAETGRQVGGIATLATAQTLGPLAGHFFYRLRPSQQGVVDAAVVTSLWSGLFATMLTAGYADPTAERSNHAAQFGTIMLATEAGVGFGVLIGRRTHFSPYRALAVHGYSIAGGLTGVIFGLPIIRTRFDRKVDENDFWRTMAFGSLLGFVAGVGSTRHLGEHANARIPLSGLSLQPLAGGGIAGVSGRF